METGKENPRDERRPPGRQGEKSVLDFQARKHTGGEAFVLGSKGGKTCNRVFKHRHWQRTGVRFSLFSVQ